ncbi:MAG: phosphate/phosphite/phosphonate ABC transporter substrate-binding protein [Thiohalomonadales bacterium]
MSDESRAIVLSTVIISTVAVTMFAVYVFVNSDNQSELNSDKIAKKSPDINIPGLDDLEIDYEKKLVMGIFPRRNTAKTIRMFNPLAHYLSKKLGMSVVVDTSSDFKTFWQKVKDKKFDIVHYNQLHYVLSNEKFNYTAIIKNQEFGIDSIRPIIAVRNDSNIKSIRDLRNKVVHFGGGKLAMVSHIANRVAIRDMGLSDNEYRWKYVKNPPRTAISVFNMSADAASIGEGVLDFPQIKRSITSKEFRKIYLGPDLPHLPWAVSDKISPDLKVKIQSAMLVLNNSNAGIDLLKNASITGFSKAIDKEYDIVRSIYKKYSSYSVNSKIKNVQRSVKTIRHSINEAEQKTKEYAIK